MRRSVVAFLFLLTIPALVAAQTDAPPPTPGRTSAQRSWGLGLSLASAGGAEDSPVNVRFPLRLGSHWRLEPEFGAYRSTRVSSVYNNGGPNTHEDVRFHGLNFSLALTSIIRIDSTARFYVGPRVGIQRNFESYDIDTGAGTDHLDIGVSDKFLGFVTGAEFGLGARMTVGGEVGVTYVSHGNADTRLPPNYSVGLLDGGHDIYTTGALVMRWFPGAL